MSISNPRRPRLSNFLPVTLLGAFFALSGAGTTAHADAGPPPPPPPGGEGGGAEGGAPPPPPAPGVGAEQAAPGGALADAEAKYKDGDYETAAIIMHKIASGATATNPNDQARAQFWLGKALYKQGFYSASLAVLDEIVAAGSGHPYHKLTLPWLASLSRELPEGAGVLEKVGTYDPQSLEDEAFDEVRDELYYLLGKFHYHKGDLGQGVALLSQVPQSSDYYIPAQYFLGVAHTREFKGDTAVEAFKNVLRRAIELQESANDKKKRKKAKKDKRKAKKKRRKGKKKSKTSVELSFEQEMRQYEHLAAFGMANVFYMLGRFDTALKYLDAIPLDSYYWLDAMFWSAWHEFRKVEVDPEGENQHYQRALGYVHTINAPFFDEYLYPETLKLKAVTYYFNCRYDSAKLAVDEFNRRYPPVKQSLQQMLSDAPEDFQLFELSQKIREEDSGLDPFLEQVALISLSDKQADNYFRYVEELEREQEMLETEMSGDFRSSSVGERVGEDLDAALSLAKEAAGAIARQRLTSRIKEIKDLEREMIKVEYEILEKRKAQKQLEQNPPKPSKPKIDSEHEIYRYNGEYWRDELGYYRYKVTRLCKE